MRRGVHAQNNTVVFDNQSGEPALVKRAICSNDKALIDGLSKKSWEGKSVPENNVGVLMVYDPNNFGRHQGSPFAHEDGSNNGARRRSALVALVAGHNLAHPSDQNCACLLEGRWIVQLARAHFQSAVAGNNELPNKPDAANPAIVSLFHAGRYWGGVANPAPLGNRQFDKRECEEYNWGIEKDIYISW